MLRKVENDTNFKSCLKIFCYSINQYSLIKMEDQLNNFRPNIIGQIIFTQMIGGVFDIDSTKFIVYQKELGFSRGGSGFSKHIRKVCRLFSVDQIDFPSSPILIKISVFCAASNLFEKKAKQGL